MLRTDNAGLARLLIFYVILYSIMPIVSRLTSNYITTYGYLLVVLLLYVVMMIVKYRKAKKPQLRRVEGGKPPRR